MEAQISDLETEVELMEADLEGHHDFLEALMDKTKRRGLRTIARRTDEAKHAAAQTLLTLLSPSLQEEIKNHAFFTAERRAYRKDDAATKEEVDSLETEELLLLKRVLKEEEERLEQEVGGLDREVRELKEEVAKKKKKKNKKKKKKKKKR